MLENWKHPCSAYETLPAKSYLPLNNAQSLEFYPVPAQHHTGLVLISITSYIWHQGHRRPEEIISEQPISLVYMCLSEVRKKKKNKKRENEHLNFPIKPVPQYESLFAFLH